MSEEYEVSPKAKETFGLLIHNVRSRITSLKDKAYRDLAIATELEEQLYRMESINDNFTVRE